MVQTIIQLEQNSGSPPANDGAEHANASETVHNNLQAPIINIVHQPIIQSVEMAHESPGGVNSAFGDDRSELDSWNFNGDNGGHTALNVYNVKTPNVKTDYSVIKTIVPVLIILIAGFTYLEFELEKSPVMITMVDLAKGYISRSPALANMNAQIQQKPTAIPIKIALIPKVPQVVAVSEQFVKKIAFNLADMNKPYALLPNFVTVDVKPAKPMWSLKEEEDLKIKMKHKYFYQHYQAVERVRLQRFLGGQAILDLALNQPFLWIKANAIIGLADASMVITEAQVKKVFMNVRKATLTNYLKRFETKSLSAGERYFMRLTLQYGHPSARLQALKNIMVSPDELSELYLNAAQRDPSEKISKWFENNDDIKHNAKFLALVDQAVELNEVLKFQHTWKYATTNQKSISTPDNKSEVTKSQPVVTFYEVKE